jgi:hypothetical protein
MWMRNADESFLVDDDTLVLVLSALFQPVPTKVCTSVHTMNTHTSTLHELLQPPHEHLS